jgi:hypothetical protein
MILIADLFNALMSKTLERADQFRLKLRVVHVYIKRPRQRIIHVKPVEQPGVLAKVMAEIRERFLCGHKPYVPDVIDRPDPFAQRVDLIGA